MTIEYASIESQEDYDNFLDYIREGDFDVDMEDNFIYVENYKIEVKKGYESIFDDIESIFNPPKFEANPLKTLEILGYIVNIY